MSAVRQCPCCELRFQWKTELEHHLRDAHEQFHTDYPCASVTAAAAQK